MEETENAINADIRLEGFITTDKVIYRPSDVAFIEVYLVDSFTKKPIAL